MASKKNKADNQWPVIKSYDSDHLGRIAMPIGGIGTGSVSLNGRGALVDWEILNIASKGFIPNSRRNSTPGFVLWTKDKSGNKTTLLLEGPLDYNDYEAAQGSAAPNAGLPRFDNCSFKSAYPFGQVCLSDKLVPVDAKLKAFNPLIPADADASGIPALVMTYELTNKTNAPIDAAVCGSVVNIAGYDIRTPKDYFKMPILEENIKTENFYKDRPYKGIFMKTLNKDKKSRYWGTMAIATTAKSKVSYKTSWIDGGGWCDRILDFWDDFSANGKLSEVNNPAGPCRMGSLAAGVKIGPKETKSVTFIITWNFPNRYGWESQSLEDPAKEQWVGNYYSTQYKDAWDVVAKTLPKLKTLEQRTIDFVDAFVKSDIPEVYKEAALFNLSTLKTQTCFRTIDGRLYGWEGCCDSSGCCYGSCTHVWNYEQAVAFLYGDLAKTMRDVEFTFATDKTGHMAFRAGLPIETNARQDKLAAADGQMGTIMKAYRDWQLSGDTKELKRLWPKIKAAMSFCWLKNSWDCDCDGVMEGCQHNTMDVEYYGPNPQMQFWYLGALKAAAKMAKFLDDAEFADKCNSLFGKGSKWTDENLFNGQYYKHIVAPPMSSKNIRKGLKLTEHGKYDNPDYQLANGCLVDQLVGQYMAHICGLGYLAKPVNIKKTLRNIVKFNRVTKFSKHFNNMRSYALGDEKGLLMASYPYDRPQFPFPHFAELMTGFEYTAAVGMIYEGLDKLALQTVSDIRDRYDGRKRSPFNEAECGHHYARAMAAWALLNSQTGFEYSAIDKTMTFNMPKQKTQWFFSTGYGWGTVTIKPGKQSCSVELKMLGGRLSIKSFKLKDFGNTEFLKSLKLRAGTKKIFKCRISLK